MTSIIKALGAVTLATALIYNLPDIIKAGTSEFEEVKIQKTEYRRTSQAQKERVRKFLESLEQEQRIKVIAAKAEAEIKYLISPDSQDFPKAQEAVSFLETLASEPIPTNSPEINIELDLTQPMSETPETSYSKKDYPEKTPSWEEIQQELTALSKNLEEARKNQEQINLQRQRDSQSEKLKKPSYQTPVLTKSSGVQTRNYGKTSIPRVWNNNPGNIRYTGKKWAGQIGVNRGFVVFQNPQYGLRALAKNLHDYQRYQADTVEEIVKKWAPESDNNPTENYIRYVCKKTGYSRNQTLDLSNREVLANLTFAIASFDSGKHFTIEHAYEGLKLLKH
jgi:hypothetical protein